MPTGTFVSVALVVSPVSAPSRTIRAPSGDEVTAMIPAGSVRVKWATAVPSSTTVTIIEASA
ncbi:MAG: hypothetical protein BWY91_02772 [bacterium ADurb.BinA028]|nr:MAG: hypothetical protein BWY91_02772 [bacterium ADurb.BinA028]